MKQTTPFIFQVRTNNKSDRIVRKFDNLNTIPEQTDVDKFVWLLCNGQRTISEGKLTWRIAL